MGASGAQRSGGRNGLGDLRAGAGEAAPARLWLLAPDDLGADALAVLGALLDPAERARAERFRAAERRLQHVAAHGLKRLALAAVVGGRPASLRFGIGPAGKPFLRDAGGLDFSLSHCEGRVGVAVSGAGAIGFDVEPRGRAVDDGVVEAFFSPAERAWLRRQPVAVADDRLRLWTAKEAVAKASGLGLVGTMDAGALLPSLLDGTASAPGGLRLWQGGLGDGHLGALALRADARPPAPIAGEIDAGIGALCLAFA